MSLISLLHHGHDSAAGKPEAVPWKRDSRGYYPRLLRIDPDSLAEEGGVYVLWHRGLHPQWIYVGATSDLGVSLGRARDAEIVLNYEPLGGVYVTWAPIRPEFRDGVVNFLRDTLNPLITDNMDDDRRDPGATPIPVVSPG
jgi:hypothetical protein